MWEPGAGSIVAKRWPVVGKCPSVYVAKRSWVRTYRPHPAPEFLPTETVSIAVSASRGDPPLRTVWHLDKLAHPDASGVVTGIAVVVGTRIGVATQNRAAENADTAVAPAEMAGPTMSAPAMTAESVAA